MLRRFLTLALLALPLALPASAAETVAVLYFDNQGNADLAPLSVGLSQMLITDLQGTPDVQIVERAQLQAILDELELGHTGVIDTTTAAQVGRLLGARWLVLGSYFEMMGTLRIDTRLVKVETGEIVHADGKSAPVAEFMTLERGLATSLRGALGRQTGHADASPAAQPRVPRPADARPSPPAQPGVRATASAAPDVIPPDPEALQAAVAYSEGLIFLDQKDLAQARDRFSKAVDANPNLDAARQELAALAL